MPTVRVNDINMYYEIHGKGELLLLIHGTCFDTTGWAQQIPSFSQKYQVIVFDNRGTGRTDTTKPPYTIEQMADDTAELMSAIGIVKTHILGYSMGSLMAQELAIKYPELIRSLTLTASYARLTPIGLERTKLIRRMFQEEVNPEIVVRNFFLWFFTDRFFENEEQVSFAVNNFLNLLSSPKAAEGLDGQVNALLNYNDRGHLHHITAPTLVVVGRDDILTPVKCSEELASSIPNAKLIILDNAAHSLPFENPERLNQVVLNWLDNTCQ